MHTVAVFRPPDRMRAGDPVQQFYDLEITNMTDHSGELRRALASQYDNFTTPIFTSTADIWR